MLMVLAGSVLLSSAGRGTTAQPELGLLGAGSSLGLAANDVAGAIRRDVAPIYYADLAWESSIAVLWSPALRAESASEASRGSL